MNVEIFRENCPCVMSVWGKEWELPHLKCSQQGHKERWTSVLRSLKGESLASGSLEAGVTGGVVLGWLCTLGVHSLGKRWLIVFLGSHADWTCENESWSGVISDDVQEAWRKEGTQHRGEPQDFQGLRKELWVTTQSFPCTCRKTQ